MLQTCEEQSSKLVDIKDDGFADLLKMINPINKTTIQDWIIRTNKQSCLNSIWGPLNLYLAKNSRQILAIVHVLMGIYMTLALLKEKSIYIYHVKFVSQTRKKKQLAIKGIFREEEETNPIKLQL